MIRYDMEKLNVDSEVTFEAIPDDQFDIVMEELDKKLNSKMLQNKIQENESIQEAINIGNFTAINEQVSQKNYKETLIETIEQYLPISYEEFKKLELDEQQRIIDSVKEQQGNIQKDLFQERFNTYISDLEEDSDLHLGLIEEDEEDMKNYNRSKVLKKRNIKKILADDIEN